MLFDYFNVALFNIALFDAVPSDVELFNINVSLCLYVNVLSIDFTF